MGWIGFSYGYGVREGKGIIVFFLEGGGGTSQLKVTIAWIIVLMVMAGS